MSIIDATTTAPALTGSKTSANKSVEDSFLEFVKQSPAERLRAAMLKELGLTEESLAAMSPGERLAIEEKIKDRLKEKMGLPKGSA